MTKEEDLAITTAIDCIENLNQQDADYQQKIDGILQEADFTIDAMSTAQFERLNKLCTDNNFTYELMYC